MAFIPEDGGRRGHLQMTAEQRLTQSPGQAFLPWTPSDPPAVVCAGETTDNANRGHHHARRSHHEDKDRKMDRLKGKGKNKAEGTYTDTVKGGSPCSTAVAVCLSKLSLLQSCFLSSLVREFQESSSRIHGYSSCQSSNLKIRRLGDQAQCYCQQN